MSAQWLSEHTVKIRILVASTDVEHHTNVFFFAPYIIVQKLPLKPLDIIC
jgi:hypothetical protein